MAITTKQQRRNVVLQLISGGGDEYDSVTDLRDRLELALEPAGTGR